MKISPNFQRNQHALCIAEFFRRLTVLTMMSALGILLPTIELGKKVRAQTGPPLPTLPNSTQWVSLASIDLLATLAGGCAFANESHAFLVGRNGTVLSVDMSSLLTLSSNGSHSLSLVSSTLFRSESGTVNTTTNESTLSNLAYDEETKSLFATVSSDHLDLGTFYFGPPRSGLQRYLPSELPAWAMSGPYSPRGVALDPRGTACFVSDFTNHRILRIEHEAPMNGDTTTPLHPTPASTVIFSGSLVGRSGFVNGNATESRFYGPTGLLYLSSTNVEQTRSSEDFSSRPANRYLLLCDSLNSIIRLISASGLDKGSSQSFACNGRKGLTDGAAQTDASCSRPLHIVAQSSQLKATPTTVLGGTFFFTDLSDLSAVLSIRKLSDGFIQTIVQLPIESELAASSPSALCINPSGDILLVGTASKSATGALTLTRDSLEGSSTSSSGSSAERAATHFAPTSNVTSATSKESFVVSLTLSVDAKMLLDETRELAELLSLACNVVPAAIHIISIHTGSAVVTFEVETSQGEPALKQWLERSMLSGGVLEHLGPIAETLVITRKPFPKEFKVGAVFYATSALCGLSAIGGIIWVVHRCVRPSGTPRVPMSNASVRISDYKIKVNLKDRNGRRRSSAELLMSTRDSAEEVSPPLPSGFVVDGSSFAGSTNSNSDARRESGSGDFLLETNIGPRGPLTKECITWIEGVRIRPSANEEDLLSFMSRRRSGPRQSYVPFPGGAEGFRDVDIVPAMLSPYRRRSNALFSDPSEEDQSTRGSPSFGSPFSDKEFLPPMMSPRATFGVELPFILSPRAASDVLSSPSVQAITEDDCTSPNQE